MPVTSYGNKIIEKKTGRVVGHSKDSETAKKAARVRNAIAHGFRPTRTKPKRSTSSSY